MNYCDYFMNDAESSKWKFYRFLDVKFHVYEMNTPIGKSNELPIHFKAGSNEKALITYENYDDFLYFLRYFFSEPIMCIMRIIAPFFELFFCLTITIIFFQCYYTHYVFPNKLSALFQLWRSK